MKRESLDFIEKYNQILEKKEPIERIGWAIEYFDKKVVLSSSFGAQAVVMIKLALSVWPEIPVVVIDTGYLFPETYKYIDSLVEKFKINLKIYRPILSAAWFEARYGKLWEKGKEGIEKYNQLMKVEPMYRALDELNVRCWISGLRREQSSTRKAVPILTWHWNRAKLHPIVDWSNERVEKFISEYKLPVHPLAYEGYVSIGDVHTTRKLKEGMSVEETRFFGIKRECGLHESRERF
ncbi:phosphoadenylyl-sulfate reductase [Methylacidiphilum caldifontis]|uniref:Phosphoadenosine 5'-phosphosulfate reductase n=1 Tax=Methylacidiphilum caldifontis TaxID=2795386 RepID=A0A4Y8P968_9BACT|nr:phosphoadenylyl-sulfate reductase [Methylacidiphilum caldifontis]QSR89493.1 phosphoadenylyl-sulfate reductase [Methylacidiphilum caldifontis]TFE67213.1 phosphoadenosine phosphosulfate reductase [Methylacidiphilum caldifontis]